MDFFKFILLIFYIFQPKKTMALIYIDGVMFDEEQTTLLHCPITITGVYKIPTTVTKIGIQAFYGCSRLLTVQLPGQLKTINMLAFEGCRHLHSICIPESVTTIGYRAFANCSELRSIQVEHETPLQCSSNCDIFISTDISKCTLIVPLDTRQAYINAPVWGKFGNIVEIGLAKEKNHINERRKIVGMMR